MTRPSQPPDLPALSLRLLRAVSHIVRHKGGPHRLSELDVGVLQFLLGRFASNTQLADGLSVEPARVARIVHRLNEQGLVVRARPPYDRRTMLNSLTEEGERLAIELRRDVLQASSELLEGVSVEELDAFVAVIEQIDANYTRMSGDGEA